MANNVNPKIVSLIESLLAKAKAGHVKGIGLIVSEGPNVMAVASEGEQPHELHTGCQLLADALRAKLISGAQRKSPIILPKAMPPTVL